MTNSRPREPALFTVVERFGIVIISMIIFLITSVLVSAEDDSRMYGEEATIVSRTLDFIRKWVPFAGELGGLCYLVVIIVVAVSVFHISRRAPQKVVAGMTCLTGINLVIVFALTPMLSTDKIRLALIFPDPRTVYFSGLEVSSFCGLYVMGLICVCIVGEFASLARERVMREELRIAEEEGEEVGRRVSLRQQLVLAALGPRTSIPLSTGRALTLIVIAPWALFTIGEIASTIQLVEGSASLPAPPIQKAGSHEQDRPLELRVDDHGIFQKSVAEPLEWYEVDSLLEKTSIDSMGARPILLHVAPNVTYERLIEIIGDARRKGLSIVLAE